MGKEKNSWQDADYVLSWFGKRAGQAQRIYRLYVSEGIRQESRRGAIPGIRSKLALNLAKDWGIPLAEIARRLGVSASAISRVLRRKTRTKSI